MASVKTRAGSISIGDNSTLLLIGGGLALAYFGVIKPVLDAGGTIAEALNLKDTKQEKEEKKVVVENAKSKGWNPNYYKTVNQNTSILLPTDGTVTRWSRDIFEAMGLINDDEEKVYGVLRKCPDQASLSLLAEKFYALFKKDLYGYIYSYFSISEMAKVAAIVQPLPPYRKVTTKKK